MNCIINVGPQPFPEPIAKKEEIKRNAQRAMALQETNPTRESQWKWPDWADDVWGAPAESVDPEALKGSSVADDCRDGHLKKWPQYVARDARGPRPSSAGISAVSAQATGRDPGQSPSHVRCSHTPSKSATKPSVRRDIAFMKEVTQGARRGGDKFSAVAVLREMALTSESPLPGWVDDVLATPGEGVDPGILLDLVIGMLGDGTENGDLSQRERVVVDDCESPDEAKRPPEDDETKRNCHGHPKENPPSVARKAPADGTIRSSCGSLASRAFLGEKRRFVTVRRDSRGPVPDDEFCGF